MEFRGERYLTSAIVFSSIMGFLLDMGGFISYTLINPITFGVGAGLLAATIALANTPSLKGIAIAAFSVWLVAFFINIQIPLPSPWTELVYAVIFVPTIIGIGFTFLDYGRV